MDSFKREDENEQLSLSLSLCVCHSHPPALGQIMLYVDGMNGLISHNETVQWLYTLVGSKVKKINILFFFQASCLVSTVEVNSLSPCGH